MTSRERVIAALNHRETDRIPIDFSGHRSSGIAAMAYRRLREHLGLPQRAIRVYDPIQQLAIVDEDVLDLFQVDTIELGRGFALEDRYWTEWELPDGSPCLMPVWAKPERDGQDWVLRYSAGVLGRMPRGVWFFEQTFWPFADATQFDDLQGALDRCMWCVAASPPGPLVSGPGGAVLLEEGARALRQRTNRAIIGLFGGNLLELGQMLYRNDNFLMLLAAEPDRAHRFLDLLLEIHLRNLEQFLRAAGPHLDVILFGDDLGMQSGPQMSTGMYREFFQPRQRRMWQLVKELMPHLKIMLHCCGGVRELLPGLIEAGLDTINPVQITCRGMDPRGLKRDFGGQLTFWGGGCDTREVLTGGTPDQVRENVRQLVSVWRPGGGFVFQQVHNIMADVPPENIVAMFEAARE